MFTPPEFIVEDTPSGGKRCVIFDPLSSGEYFSFSINRLEPIEIIRSRIRNALENANDIFLKEIYK